MQITKTKLITMKIIEFGIYTFSIFLILIGAYFALNELINDIHLINDSINTLNIIFIVIPAVLGFFGIVLFIKDIFLKTDEYNNRGYLRLWLPVIFLVYSFSISYIYLVMENFSLLGIGFYLILIITSVVLAIKKIKTGKYNSIGEIHKIRYYLLSFSISMLFFFIMRFVFFIHVISSGTPF